MPATDESAVRALYEQLMDAWNAGDGAGFAAAFTEDGDLVGFDGTHFVGREVIGAAHQALFDKWLKGTRLVGSVDTVRLLGPDVAIMHALGGTIARGRSKPDRARASIQTLVARRTEDEGWRLAAFHNTRVRPIGRSALTFFHWSAGDFLWRVLRLSTDPTPRAAAR